MPERPIVVVDQYVSRASARGAMACGSDATRSLLIACLQLPVPALNFPLVPPTTGGGIGRVRSNVTWMKDPALLFHDSRAR